MASNDLPDQDKFRTIDQYQQREADLIALLTPIIEQDKTLWVEFYLYKLVDDLAEGDYKRWELIDVIHGLWQEGCKPASQLTAAELAQGIVGDHVDPEEYPVIEDELNLIIKERDKYSQPSDEDEDEDD